MTTQEQFQTMAVRAEERERVQRALTDFTATGFRIRCDLCGTSYEDDSVNRLVWLRMHRAADCA